MGGDGITSCFRNFEMKCRTGYLVPTKTKGENMPKIKYDKVQDFITSLVPSREPEMQKMEKYAEKKDFPIIGAACGYRAWKRCSNLPTVVSG